MEETRRISVHSKPCILQIHFTFAIQILIILGMSLAMKKVKTRLLEVRLVGVVVGRKFCSAEQQHLIETETKKGKG
jgi:hypothetical protein